MIQKVFEPQHLREYAEHNLRMKVKVREKQVKDRAYLKVTVFTPWGVKLEGKETDEMSFELSGKLEGSAKLVTHYLVMWAAAALTKLAPQIERGEILDIPQFKGQMA